MLSENEPVPNNSVVDQRTHHVTVNNRFSCIPHHNIGPSLDTRHPGELDTITVIVRSSDHDEDAYSLSRASTKASPRLVEQATAGEMD